MPRLTLLVVDDEPLICHAIRCGFASSEIEVLTAGSLAEGARLLNDEQPDVVVLDLHLPDGSGLDLFALIRATNTKIPVILFTAQEATAATDDVVKPGAFGYLTKPSDLEQMCDILNRAFEAARSPRDDSRIEQSSEY